ncbi:MAG TPA: ABC transporter ATP-binding protein [Stellaceae bacterium]|nr:ABC transporter ATP-binding protein [Stellaceae bacterium]
MHSDCATPAVPPILELEAVSKRFGATVTADRLSLKVAPGAFFTFLGPSGSGKSTILRMIAGLERPDAGRILIDGRDVAAVPPWRRNLGMVFQHYAVFPHMRVAENVAYGLRVRSTPRASIERRVDEMLELVGLPGFRRRDAATLSGGEQQRVALARALAPAPRMLLLDEPLSALDDRIRRDMQSELKHIQRRSGTTFLYVTHDQEEALTMSDRIAVLDRGVCAQEDAPEALFRRPRNRFVASFFRGCNVLDAEIKAIAANRMQVLVAGMPVDFPLATEGTTAPSQLGLAIRCENLRLGRSAEASPLRLAARLEEIIYRGTNVDHVLRLADGQKLTATSTRYELGEGAMDVVVGCDPADLVPLDD